MTLIEQRIAELSRLLAKHFETPLMPEASDYRCSAVGWWTRPEIPAGRGADHYGEWQPRLITEPEVFVRVLEALGDCEIYIFDKDSAASFRDGFTHKVTAYGKDGDRIEIGRGASLELAAAEALVKVLRLEAA